MTRRLLLYAVPATLALIGCGGWLIWPRTAITKESFAQIRKGMSRAEVDVILGGPPRDESTSLVGINWGEGWKGVAWDQMTDAERQKAQFESFREPMNFSGRLLPEWTSDFACIQIGFDRHDRVYDQICYPVICASPIERLGRWLGW